MWLNIFSKWLNSARHDYMREALKSGGHTPRRRWRFFGCLKRIVINSRLLRATFVPECVCVSVRCASSMCMMYTKGLCPDGIRRVYLSSFLGGFLCGKIVCARRHHGSISARAHFLRFLAYRRCVAVFRRASALISVSTQKSESYI